MTTYPPVSRSFLAGIILLLLLGIANIVIVVVVTAYSLDIIGHNLSPWLTAVWLVADLGLLFCAIGFLAIGVDL